jgi:hypothetical protein
LGKKLNLRNNLKIGYDKHKWTCASKWIF